MLKTSVICFLASYCCAFACELVQLKGRHALTRMIALLFGTAGLVAQTTYLLNRSRASELAPLLSSAHDWLLVLSWIVVLVYLFVSMADSQLAIGLVIWPVVLSLVISAQFVTASPSQILDYHREYRGWKMLHASMLVLGTAGILQGFILSLLYLWQHRRLKHRQTNDSSVKLPNLERIERLNLWSILISVPLLTIGVVSGFGLSIIPKGSNLTMMWTDPVVIGGAVTWTLMGVLFFWLLTQKRTPGKQVALLTAWSCGFLLVTLVGLEMLIAAVGTHGVHGAPVESSTKIESETPKLDLGTSEK
jgi:ABC-type uncharacterized transport system permease subunit